MHEDEEEVEVQSKSSKKREMHALQDLGEELVALSKERLEEIGLPEKLLDAVREARKLTNFGALRRQMQYIGKLMREVEPEEIRRKLSQWDAQSKENAAELHLVERWRERLLEDDSAFDEFARSYPDSDITRLRTLARSILKDRAAGKPPKQYRPFFRMLREAIRKETD